MNKYTCYYTPKGESSKVAMLIVSINEDRVCISTDNISELFEIIDNENFEERQKIIDIATEIRDFRAIIDGTYERKTYSDKLINEISGYVYRFMTSLCRKFKGLTCEHTFE